MIGKLFCVCIYLLCIFNLHCVNRMSFSPARFPRLFWSLWPLRIQISISDVNKVAWKLVHIAITESDFKYLRTFLSFFSLLFCTEESNSGEPDFRHEAYADLQIEANHFAILELDNKNGKRLESIIQQNHLTNNWCILSMLTLSNGFHYINKLAFFVFEIMHVWLILVHGYSLTYITITTNIWYDVLRPASGTTLCI